jgi:hypothetical protein
MDGETGFRSSGVHVSQYTPRLGEMICRRAAAGESLMSIGREVGMPSRDTIRNWRLRHEDFAQALAKAQREGRRRARVCDGLVQAMKPRGVRRGVKGGRITTYRPKLAQEICERIAMGEALSAICAEAGMPCAVSVYNWLRIHPDFADLYAQAREVQAHLMFDQMGEIARRVTPETAGASRLAFDILRWQAARLAPKKYGERIGDLEPDRRVTVVIRRFGDED